MHKKWDVHDIPEFSWRSGWDSNPRAREGKLISSQPRYDHFDTAPRHIKLTCLLYRILTFFQSRFLPVLEVPVLEVPVLGVPVLEVQVLLVLHIIQRILCLAPYTHFKV